MTPARARDGDAARPRPLRPVTPAEAPALTVAAVARRLGVAPATLRTWDRRYGLGPSEHSAGSHRRYTSDDVARLLVMRRLTLEGVAPSRRPAPPATRTRPSRATPAHGSSRRTAPARPARWRRPRPSSRRRCAGTRPGCRALLQSADGDLGSWWVSLVEPTRASLATRTTLARPGQDPEAVLDAAVLACAAATARCPPRCSPPSGSAWSCCSPRPDHTRPLALHALAGALTDRGVDARVLTGPVDRHRVLELAVMVQPVAVVLVGERAHPDLAIVGELHTAQPALPLFVGLVDDEAAATLPLDRSVHRARSFTGLLHEVLAVSNG